MSEGYYGGTVHFPKVSRAQRVTGVQREHLLATYYGITSFDSNERYITVLETEVRERLPTVDDVATLGLLDLKRGEFIRLSQTRAWNFQQGCMAHWLGEVPHSMIIYNDFRDEKFVSVVHDVSSNKEIIIPRPISGVSPDGRRALSINFARLRITRPDYGYDGNGDNPRADEPYPTEDGLFLIDLDTGGSELIMPYSDMKGLIGLPPDVQPNSLLWLNHTIFNRDGTRIFFLVRINKRGGGWYTASITLNTDGSDLRPVFPSPWNWGGSHYDWLSRDRLMVTARYQETGYVPTLFTDGKDDYRILGNGLLDFDGHGTFSPNGKWMAFDSYPDSNFHKQNLLLMDMTTNAVLSLGRFYEPLRFYGPGIPEYWRCDLHPCWSPKGDMIAFNSTHENTRQVYVVHLNGRES